MGTALKKKYDFIIRYFSERNPDAAPELIYSNSFELLVAVMLSAQCTDKRVNLVTPALFKKYPTPEKMATAGIDEILEYVKSVSYPNSKAAHLSAMAQMLVRDFACQVPDNMEDLQKLPGVGRKTANVILAVIYNRPAMPVDTHVFRVSHRLGLVQNADTPVAVEKQLVAHIPAGLLSKAHHWLILHGRYVCTARAPHCDQCGLQAVCNFIHEKKA